MAAPTRWSLRGWRRTRVAVYLAFAAIAANAGVQAWQAQRLAKARAHDADIVEAASHHQTLSQRIGRLAALVAAQPEPNGRAANDLAQELAQSRVDALACAGAVDAGRPS